MPHEDTALVNALQRHVSFVLQKSIREVFGLAAAEAMERQARYRRKRRWHPASDWRRSEWVCSIFCGRSGRTDCSVD